MKFETEAELGFQPFSFLFEREKSGGVLKCKISQPLDRNSKWMFLWFEIKVDVGEATSYAAVVTTWPYLCKVQQLVEFFGQHKANTSKQQR